MEYKTFLIGCGCWSCACRRSSFCWKSGRQFLQWRRSPDAAKSNVDEIPEITLHNVSFQYGDQVILQDINYSFHAGCKYAVMGESGSGKTTLTKIILGLLPGALYHKIAENILNNSFDAEECVNDACLGVWNTIPPKKPDPLLAYVCRIVRNISITRYHAKLP